MLKLKLYGWRSTDGTQRDLIYPDRTLEIDHSDAIQINNLVRTACAPMCRRDCGHTPTPECACHRCIHVTHRHIYVHIYYYVYSIAAAAAFAQRPYADRSSNHTAQSHASRKVCKVQTHGISAAPCRCQSVSSMCKRCISTCAIVPVAPESGVRQCSCQKQQLLLLLLRYAMPYALTLKRVERRKKIPNCSVIGLHRYWPARVKFICALFIIIFSWMRARVFVLSGVRK